MFDMSEEEEEEQAQVAATVGFDTAVPDGGKLTEDVLEEELVYEESEDPGTVVPIGEERRRPVLVGTAEGREELRNLLTGMESVPADQGDAPEYRVAASREQPEEWFDSCDWRLGAGNKAAQGRTQAPTIAPVSTQATMMVNQAASATGAAALPAQTTVLVGPTTSSPATTAFGGRYGQCLLKHLCSVLCRCLRHKLRKDSPLFQPRYDRRNYRGRAQLSRSSQAFGVVCTSPAARRKESE
ncbi:hypothetical protein JG688_00015688 [Phytophthora aleatoria]|uniref:Uncharacterized protein n=1 Tax=Phytophthora aleatoria TaxID=2496075 RepID=A0A8J5IZ55_9STRA|nr:hypothetical protein JG688_00015688 [Phytophthora aleatoria]